MESALFMAVNQLVTSQIAEYIEDRRAVIVETYAMGVLPNGGRVPTELCSVTFG